MLGVASHHGSRRKAKVPKWTQHDCKGATEILPGTVQTVTVLTDALRNDDFNVPIKLEDLASMVVVTSFEIRQSTLARASLHNAILIRDLVVSAPAARLVEGLLSSYSL